MRYVVFCLAVMMVSLGLSAPVALADNFEVKQKTYPRVRTAFGAHEAEWKQRFKDRAAAWPPRDVYLRAFKVEGELELWAAPAKGKDGPLVRVHTFPICASSGDLGLKRKSGDGQVPEGFYRIDRFNPRSQFLLSLGLDYPNAWDKARAARDGLVPGGDIFIHGSCFTIGCLPLGDEAIAGLYLVAVKARAAGQRTLHVMVAPCRFGAEACEARLAKSKPDADTLQAYTVLRAAHKAFVAEPLRPDVVVTTKGYRLRAAGR